MAYGTGLLGGVTVRIWCHSLVKEGMTQLWLHPHPQEEANQLEVLTIIHTEARQRVSGWAVNLVPLLSLIANIQQPFGIRTFCTHESHPGWHGGAVVSAARRVSVPGFDSWLAQGLSVQQVVTRLQITINMSEMALAWHKLRNIAKLARLVKLINMLSLLACCWH